MVILRCYHEPMGFTKYAKRSISLPVELDAELEQQAEAEGTTVSALLATAAERSLRIRRGLAAVEDWKRETGITFTPEQVTEVDALLDAAGVVKAGVVQARADKAGVVQARADVGDANRPSISIK